MAEAEFPGFHYDSGHAEAIAQALLTVLNTARAQDTPAMDQLAALGIAAAEVLARSKLARRPEVVAGAFAVFVTTQVRARMPEEAR